MIDANEINEILATYKKYGWELRRVLLTAELKKSVGELFEGISVADSAIDAAWFSRAPQPGVIAWEIRHLSTAPYALLEHLDETDADFESALRVVETRLRDAVAKKQQA
ncbi:MAG TPA: hypothetical protein PLL77_03570 [Pyrinomonadaceae bacterium]|nr:hypothetical protein [Pyrinomonadaceae bacterium]